MLNATKTKERSNFKCQILNFICWCCCFFVVAYFNGEVGRAMHRIANEIERAKEKENLIYRFTCSKKSKLGNRERRKTKQNNIC